MNSAASYAQERAVRSYALVKALVNKDAFIEEVFKQNPDSDGLRIKSTALKIHRNTKANAKTNEMLASKTDPEAEIVRRGSLNPRLCYKGHFAVDGGAQE